MNADISSLHLLLGVGGCGLLVGLLLIILEKILFLKMSNVIHQSMIDKKTKKPKKTPNKMPHTNDK